MRSGSDQPDEDDVPTHTLIMLDATGSITSCGGDARVLGHRAAEVIGRSLDVLWPDAGETVRAARADGRREVAGFAVQADGSRFPAILTVAALNGGFAAVISEAIGAAGGTARHILRVQELDRQRLAGYIHDEPLQAMAAVLMYTQLLAAKFPDSDHRDLALVNDTVATAVRRLRELIFRLRPAPLEQGRLEEALRVYLDQVTKYWSVGYKLNYEPGAEPPADTGVAVFRLVQDSLGILRSEGPPSDYHLAITAAEGELCVEIAAEPAAEPTEMLTHMDENDWVVIHERTESVGGRWTIDTQPGNGPTVRFWLPIDPGSRPEPAAAKE